MKYYTNLPIRDKIEDDDYIRFLGLDKDGNSIRINISYGEFKKQIKDDIQSS